jgi:hypothetical protein
LKELIIPQGTSGCDKRDEDDGSSDDEWIDISHSSEDDNAEGNVDTQKEISGRKEADRKHDDGAINANEKEDGDKVILFI